MNDIDKVESTGDIPSRDRMYILGCDPAFSGRAVISLWERGPDGQMRFVREIENDESLLP